MNSKKKFTFIDICLAPFLFIASFIKHFFIGVKFVFFDAFVNIFEVLSDKNQNKVINDKKNNN